MLEKITNKYNYIHPFKKRLTFIKFFVIGGFCGFLDLVLLYFFTDILHIWYFYSGIMSFFVVSIISFMLNRSVTFKDKSSDKKNQYLKYTAVIMVGMAINNSFLFIFTSLIGIWYILSRVFSSLIALIWNYSASKKFIFLNSNKS